MFGFFDDDDDLSEKPSKIASAILSVIGISTGKIETRYDREEDHLDKMVDAIDAEAQRQRREDVKSFTELIDVAVANPRADILKTDDELREIFNGVAQRLKGEPEIPHIKAKFENWLNPPKK